jgi:hypothetical protein
VLPHPETMPETFDEFCRHANRIRMTA